MRRFWEKEKKKDLLLVATELGEAVSEDMKVIELKQIIVGSKNFEEEFVKNLLETIMNERMESENLERQALAWEVQNHNDARNSGKTPELNFDKRKRLQCYECGSFNRLRPQCPNLKTQKVELCRIGVKSEGSLLDPYTSKGKRQNEGEHVFVQHLLDDHMICLPVAEVDIEYDLGTVTSKAAVIGNHLDQRRYILGNQTAALLQGIEENCPSYVGKVNTVVTRSQTRQSKENEIFDESDQNDEQTELNLEEGTDNLENGEILPPIDCCSPINPVTQIKIKYFYC
ncbi:retrovirus-related Pol polyprotein from transposon 297 [Trichonephila clavipes]|nr:retrovirus-related Pol polyprotein from transposon 297 [Trichonephila clavipes]